MHGTKTFHGRTLNGSNFIPPTTLIVCEVSKMLPQDSASPTRCHSLALDDYVYCRNYLLNGPNNISISLWKLSRNTLLPLFFSPPLFIQKSGSMENLMILLYDNAEK